MFLHVPVDRVHIKQGPGESELKNGNAVEFTLTTPASEQTFTRRITILHAAPNINRVPGDQNTFYFSALWGNTWVTGYYDAHLREGWFEETK